MQGCDLKTVDFEAILPSMVRNLINKSRFNTTLLITGLLVCLVIGVVSISQLFQKSLWTLETINQSFQVQIPNTSSNINYEGHRDRGGFLRLRFDAPPKDALLFTNQFCEGVLHAGYDPFAAIELAEPFTYTYLIKIDKYSYYSYSPNTPKTVLGNRCLFARSYGQLQIRLDTTDPNLYVVNIDRRFSCEEACHFMPLNVVKPITHAPIEVLGINKVEDHYALAYQELCIGLELKSVAEREKWRNLLGGNATVQLDGQAVGGFNIALDGTLDFETNSTEANQQLEGWREYYYCLPANEKQGTRQMSVHVTTLSGQELIFTWEFEVA
jgi:hypothetical protein